MTGLPAIIWFSRPVPPRPDTETGSGCRDRSVVKSFSLDPAHKLCAGLMLSSPDILPTRLDSQARQADLLIL
ncbi:hypothetical protein KAW65_08825 [candidate division WOR-3 bacterium]|nr:hypothetical protein [candidate division WOR-3 bacterium]